MVEKVLKEKVTIRLTEEEKSVIVMLANKSVKFYL